jgi:hypothetical protein
VDFEYFSASEMEEAELENDKETKKNLRLK